LTSREAVLTLSSAKDEMKRLSEKYPNGFDDFKEVVPED